MKWVSLSIELPGHLKISKSLSSSFSSKSMSAAARTSLFGEIVYDGYSKVSRDEYLLQAGSPRVRFQLVISLLFPTFRRVHPLPLFKIWL